MYERERERDKVYMYMKRRESNRERGWKNGLGNRVRVRVAVNSINPGNTAKAEAANRNV